MKRLMIFFLLMAWAGFSAAGQVSPKTAELGWLELPAFSEDPEHFFVSHYTDEYWGKQRNYSLFWDVGRQIPLWVAYPLNERLVGRGSRSGAWQYDKDTDQSALTIFQAMPKELQRLRRSLPEAFWYWAKTYELM